MITLGIDLSMTGTGVVRLKDGHYTSQLIKTKPTKSAEEEVKRLQTIRDKIEMNDIDLAVIEGLSYATRNTTSLIQLAALNYMVRERLMMEKIQFIIVAPTTLKKFVTGKGNAQKDLMLLETYKRYKVNITDNNIMDGYGLARIGEALLDNKVQLTEKQKEVVELLRKQLVI